MSKDTLTNPWEDNHLYYPYNIFLTRNPTFKIPNEETNVWEFNKFLFTQMLAFEMQNGTNYSIIHY